MERVCLHGAEEMKKKKEEEVMEMEKGGDAERVSRIEGGGEVHRVHLYGGKTDSEWVEKKETGVGRGPLWSGDGGGSE